MQSHKLNLRYCGVKTCCYNRGTTSTSIRFYKIDRNPHWFRIIQTQQISSNRMICHEHFASDCFANFERKILSENAVPTIFDEISTNQSNLREGNQETNSATQSMIQAYQKQIDDLQATIKELNDQASVRQVQYDVEMDEIMAENDRLKLQLGDKDATIKALRSLVKNEKRKNDKLAKMIEVLTGSNYLSQEDASCLNVSKYYAHCVYMIAFATSFYHRVLKYIKKKIPNHKVYDHFKNAC